MMTPTMTIKDPTRVVVRDLDTAERLWKGLSPRRTIYDDWWFRYSFFESLDRKIYFATLYDALRPLAFLPLQQDALGRLEFFGGPFMEDNTAFVRSGYESLAGRLYSELPGPVELNDIGERDPCRTLCEPEDYSGYAAKLAGISSGYAFLERNFSSKSRANLRKTIARLRNDYSVAVYNGVESDLELLFELNIRNFGEESAFRSPARKAAFRKLYREASEVVLLTLWAEGRKIGVSLALGFRDTYYYLNAGVDYETYSGAGSFLIYANIEEAIRRGKRIFDAGVEDLGWKERWHLERLPRFRFRKQD